MLNSLTPCVAAHSRNTRRISSGAGIWHVRGSEPSSDLSKRRRLADAAKDMLDPLLLTVRGEAGFASAYAPEL